MSTLVTLRRVLKFRTIVSTSTGLAYAAVSLLGCIQLAYYLGGDSGWVAILIAGLLALLPPSASQNSTPSIPQPRPSAST